MYKPKIGITIGDLNGIGPEVIVKTLSDNRLLQFCIPVIFASNQIIDYYINALNLKRNDYVNIQSSKHIKLDKINVIEIWKEQVKIQPNQFDKENGKLSTQSIIEACKAIKDKSIDAIVTAPVQKASLIINGKTYRGHTDLFRELFNTPEALMIMVSPKLRIALLTEHIPVAEIHQYITKEKITDTLHILNKSLVHDFNIIKPKIAVFGLNPHNGDDGLIGEEEQKYILPALKSIREESNILAFGPYSADSFWAYQKTDVFDGMLAMYHDQALIPFKMQFGDIGVNFSASLPFVRTSPDHGTAMDIAGQNKANPTSFRNAIFLAIDTVRNNISLNEMSVKPLKKKTSQEER